jgi:hypothetical protein
MRKAGTSVQEIAKRFNLSTKAVNYGIQRQLARMNQEALLAYPEMLRMELERLDTLQQSIWPLTQHRKIAMDDGTEVVVEPDLKAVQQALSIMDRRSKLLGMEAVNINVMTDSMETTPAKAVLAEASDKAAAVDEFDPETEAKRLIELMGMAGVLPAATTTALLGGSPALPPGPPDDDPEDAVLIPDEVIR